MRRVVLYVDSLKIGGAERVTLTFARWLQRNGWEPIVLTRQSPALDFYPIPAGVKRSVEPQDPRWLRLLGRWGFPWRVRRLRRWLRDQEVTLAIVTMCTGVSGWYRDDGPAAAPLLAEHLAAQICGDASPLPRELIEATAPARFIIRSLK